MPSPKEVIENIRKIRFQIGLDTKDLSDDQKAALRDKEEVIKDAAQLASEINTRKPHFIFELIQNAEDNDYEQSETPKIKFIINSNKLIIQNNEKGFEKEHVEALCRVGGSTKRNRTLGYIGEKGIGFKSVFMISDEPHIYSNGFRFQFKREKEKPESIIIPHWVNTIHHLNVDTKQTNIVLPFKPEEKSEIKQYIDQIHPSLLLFLKKLKIIEIEDSIKIPYMHENRKIKRYDHNGLIVIEHGEKKSYWRAIKKTFSETEIPEQIKEERLRGIHDEKIIFPETDLILAFPLNEDGSADTSNEQSVFAFLPVKRYGFKFIIQADFLLIVNREDIIKDNEWNKWLRNSITTVFLDAINEFKVDKKLRYTFYNYLSFDEVKDDFFLPVVEQIYKELQNIECILTETNQWKKPSDVLIGDKEIRKLVSNEDLKNFFGKEYLSTEIKAKKIILRKLGVEDFSIEKLIKCLENTEWVKKQSDEWFAFLYEYLSKRELFNDQLKQLKGLDIIRLENEELTSVKDEAILAIFFPLNEKGKGYGFENELRIIKREIFDIISGREGQEEDLKIKEFLKNLGVLEPVPYEIIESHIWWRIYENDGWKQKDPATLLGCVKYIKENIKAYTDHYEYTPKDWLLIRVGKSAEGTIDYKLPEDIYLPKIYGNKNDLETLFEGIDVNFVHPCYIEDVPNESNESELQRDDKIKEWRDFFIELRVNEIPKVVYTSAKIKDPYPSLAQNYGYYDSKLRYKSYLQEDYFKTSYKAFEEITDYKLELDVQRLNLKQRILFLRILERNWSRYKEDFSKQLVYRHRYLRSSYKWEVDRKDCHFKYSLINISWLPTTKGTFAKPSEVFLNNPQIKELLGDSVSYLKIDIKNEEFIDALGINSKANVKSVLNSLKVLVEQGCDDKTKFDRLYEFLNGHYFDEDSVWFKQTFSANALIYIPDTREKFFNKDEVLWEDEVRDIFGENRGYLEGHYPDLKSFFVEKLGVSEKPLPKDYAKVLEDLSLKKEITREDEQIILKIYKELNRNLNPDNVEKLISKGDWWSGFIKKSIFFTENKGFRRNDGDIFINDNPELYDLFKDHDSIAFLKLPKNYYPKIKYFIEAAGILYLSKEVDISLIDDAGKVSEQDLTDQIQKLTPYILQYLYKFEYERYKTLKDDKDEGALTQLKNLACYSVESLQVKYKLKGQPASLEQPPKAHLYNGNLYIQKDHLEDVDYIAVELSKLFGELRGLDDFLISLFSKRTDDEIENLLRAKNIQELPEEEQNWLGIKSHISVENEVLEEKAAENEENAQGQEPLGTEKVSGSQSERGCEEAEINFEEHQHKEKNKSIDLGVKEEISKEQVLKGDVQKEKIYGEETPSPETPPKKTSLPETPIRETGTVITERQIRNSKLANLVKVSYSYHCQICLSRENPEILTYNKSYAGQEENRKSLMEAHHIKEVAKDQGHDHPGNYLSLCHHHHALLYKLNLSLDNVKDSLSNVVDKEIVWPNGEIVRWKMLTLSNEFVEGNQAIQIVINQEHLEKLKEYLTMIGEDSIELVYNQRRN